MHTVICALPRQNSSSGNSNQRSVSFVTGTSNGFLVLWSGNTAVACMEVCAGVNNRDHVCTDGTIAVCDHYPNVYFYVFLSSVILCVPHLSDLYD